MGEVNIDSNLENKLYNLVFTLHSKEYFGFIESAFDYVDKIIEFIQSIPSQKYKPTYNKKFGAYYISYKANSNTTWYIIFDKQENRYFVNEITNNHCADYAYVVSVIR
jgi:hypothetical protein